MSNENSRPNSQRRPQHRYDLGDVGFFLRAVKIDINNLLKILTRAVTADSSPRCIIPGSAIIKKERRGN